jgi:cell division ATPase FtsA
VRLGFPNGTHGLTEPTAGPQYATAIGLALYGARNRPPRQRVSLRVPVGGLARVGDRVKAWISEMF